MTGRVVTAEAEIHAPRSRVWRALTDPDEIQRYMFGSRVETDWKPGSRITWKGEYEGKKYEDKGQILEVVQDRRLKVTHFSPLSDKEDPARELPHARVRTERGRRQDLLYVSLSQDNNPTAEAVEHWRANWEKVPSALKEVVEAQS